MKKHEEIQKLAYNIFEKSSREHGKDLDHWLEAERIIQAREANAHATGIVGAELQKRIVERSDIRRHEAKKTGKTKKAK